MDYHKLLELVQIQDPQIINIWLVGSRLHGLSSPDSDYDFLMIVTEEALLPLGKRIEIPGLDVTIFTRTEYIDKISKGDDFQTIEPLWVPDEYRWKFSEDFLAFWNSDPSALRTAVSTIANKGDLAGEF